MKYRVVRNECDPLSVGFVRFVTSSTILFEESVCAVLTKETFSSQERDDDNDYELLVISKRSRRFMFVQGTLPFPFAFVS